MSHVSEKKSDKCPYDQASVVPYRFRDGRLEFCLITSVRKGRWGFPKGIIDPGEAPVETALKEADEEAGLHGNIRGKALGTYEYAKCGRALNVVVWLMEVREAADQWDESALRDRKWLSYEDASHLLDRRKLRHFLLEAAKRLNQRDK